jgi:outer membrane immunogenic protein
MRKLTLLSGVAAVAVVTALSGPGYAADLPRKAPAYAPPAPIAIPITWTGWYFGGTLGYGTSKFHGNMPSSGDFFTVKPKGFTVGLHGGYNWQFAPQWLVGVEVDVTATPWGKKSAFTCAASCTSGMTGELHGLATVRGRLGWVIDRTLIYATGGVAWASKTSAANSSFGSNGGFQSANIKSGWVAGGGVEYKFTQQFSGRIEYLYYGFNENSVDAVEVANGNVPNSQGIKNAQVFRVGASWHFN